MTKSLTFYSAFKYIGDDDITKLELDGVLFPPEMTFLRSETFCILFLTVC
jgi:hypothetical protein